MNSMEFVTYKLGDLVEIKNGKDHKHLAEGKYPVLGSGGVMRYAESYLYDKASILLPRKGTLTNIQYVEEPFWTVDTLFYTHLNNELYEPYYLYRYIDSLDLSGYDSGASIPSMTKKGYNKIKIDLPSITVQREISQIIKKYDKLIENNNKRIKLLEQMVEELYKEWFVRFRYPGAENVEHKDGIPKNWKYIRLGERMTFIRGKSYSSSDIQNGNNILLSMNNIKPWGGFIRDFTREFGGKYQSKHVVKYGDLIMSITDMTQDRRIIGYVGLFDSKRTDCIMSTHLMKIETNINHLFLLGFFNYSGLSKMIAEFATGANVLGLTETILNRIKTYIPTDEIINKYGEIVKPYYDEITILKNKNDNLVKQRDLLLPRLMSGKLEVK